jgi:molecular chaperone GrpE
MQDQEKMQEQEKSGEQDVQVDEKTPDRQSSAPDSASSAVKPDIERQPDSAEAKAAEMQDAFLRAKAEAENSRRRAQEEIARAYKYAIEKFAETLLPVKDSLEMALQVATPSVDAIRQGVEMTLKQLSSAFEKNSLLEINPQPGEKLDPMQHQAVSTVPADQAPNTIVNVLQKGYMLADRLLRPALVTVAQEKPSSE